MRCVVFELAGGGGGGAHMCPPPPAVRRWLRPPALRELTRLCHIACSVVARIDMCKKMSLTKLIYICIDDVDFSLRKLFQVSHFDIFNGSEVVPKMIVGSSTFRLLCVG